MSGGLAEQLRAARRRAFVGREAELAHLSKLLAPDAGGALAYVHGPGGVGKSTLLRQAAMLADGAGRPLVWLDGRDLAPDGAELAAAFAAPAVRAEGAPWSAGTARGGRAEGAASSAGTARGGRAAAPLVVVDAAERLGPADRWLREDLLATLPRDAVVLIAGREPPPLAWRVDPGWRELVRVVPLANLDQAEGSQMLAALGVPGDEHTAAMRFTRGHPLALALVADVYAQHGRRVPLAADPQIVTTLLAGLLDAVPGPDHRSALEACAQVRVTTEPLLAALLDVPDARDLFDWLRGLSIMEFGPSGLLPHDLAREALAAELRWRHPERHALFHRRAGAYYQQQFAAGDPTGQHGVITDFAYLHRDSQALRPFLSMLAPATTAAGELTVTPAGPADHSTIRALIERYEGGESAAIAAYWLGRQPGGAMVVRDTDGTVAGCSVMVALEAATAADRRMDPAVDRALDRLARLAPPRAGETAALVRFWLSAAEYQEPSPVCTLITLHQIGRCLTTPGLAVTMVAYADPDFWAPASAYADFSRLPEADFTVGPRTYGVYVHDWRAVPPLAWLGLLAARETADEPLAVVPETAAAPLRVLDADEFAAAVRSALADIGRPDRLAASALLRSRILASKVDTAASVLDRGRAVQRLIREAAGQLAESPRDRRGYRALHHAYLQPAGSQQRAADLLDLPISTFRRHLAAGLGRLTELLWQQELAR